MVTMSLARIRPSSARTLERDFYQRPATHCVTDFLGKVLVRRTSAGRIAGVIRDVEAYPAFTDDVHHGNTRTPRTTVLWEAGGVAYVYLIYGKWHQFANSPGKLCQSFQITKSLYGADLSGNELSLEDWGITVDPASIRTTERVGINPRHTGHDTPLRYCVS